jgi:hypothetical protein
MLNAVAFLAAVAIVTGCGDQGKVTIPSKIDQPLPKVASPAGGGGDAAGKNKVGAAATKNKDTPPTSKID